MCRALVPSRDLVGSLLKERYIRALVPSSDSCQIFASVNQWYAISTRQLCLLGRDNSSSRENLSACTSCEKYFSTRFMSTVKRLSVLGTFSLLRFYLTHTIHWYSDTLIIVMQYEETVLRTYLLNCRNCRIAPLAFWLSLIMTAVPVNYFKI